MITDLEPMRDRCISLLQELIRIPSVNRGSFEVSDGNERPCAELLATFLREAGLEPKLLEGDKNRTNVVARIKGTGKKPPLLLNAHLDVVEADESEWSRPPFSGEIHDGYVWGRGTIDMKHMAAMSACTLALLAARKEPLDRDVIFAGVADEEAGCRRGASYLVEQHPDEVRAEYMLGEVGAFSLYFLGNTFYPIQVAEKGTCWVEAKITGDAGHGSMPNPESAVIKLGRALSRLGKKRLPVHPTAVVERFVHGLSAKMPAPHRAIMRRLTTPQLAGLILDTLVREPSQRRSFGAMLANTASPTVVRAGNKTNVIPGFATVEIDGRTLPGQSDAAFLDELRAALGEDAELRVLHSAPPVEASSETMLFQHLSAQIRKHDPLGAPLPYLIPGFTDAKAYSRLGTHCYGFSPVRFDPTADIAFTRMYHGKDERVPVDGLRWGFGVLYDTVLSFCRAS